MNESDPAGSGASLPDSACPAVPPSEGVPLLQGADETTSGPASCLVVDPDGNPILVDQHV